MESDIWKSTMNVNNTRFKNGKTDLGLAKTAARIDDAINALSFGRDNITKFESEGGQFWFSVDTYATGLSPLGVDNPENGVFDEATIVNEAAGDVFRSHTLNVGANPLTNQNLKTKNTPNSDVLHPLNNLNTNTTYADSYFMGLTGPRVADNEDDVNGLEGLGVNEIDPTRPLLEDDFVFFSLDRGSPTGHIADVLVSKSDGLFSVYATAEQLGLQATDNLDGLLVPDQA